MMSLKLGAVAMCVVGATIVAWKHPFGWGWFLFVAVLIASAPA